MKKYKILIAKNNAKWGGITYNGKSESNNHIIDFPNDIYGSKKDSFINSQLFNDINFDYKSYFSEVKEMTLDNQTVNGEQIKIDDKKLVFSISEDTYKKEFVSDLNELVNRNYAILQINDGTTISYEFYFLWEPVIEPSNRSTKARIKFTASLDIFFTYPITLKQGSQNFIQRAHRDRYAIDENGNPYYIYDGNQLAESDIDYEPLINNKNVVQPINVDWETEDNTLKNLLNRTKWVVAYIMPSTIDTNKLSIYKNTTQGQSSDIFSGAQVLIFPMLDNVKLKKYNSSTLVNFGGIQQYRNFVNKTELRSLPVLDAFPLNWKAYFSNISMTNGVITFELKQESDGGALAEIVDNSLYLKEIYDINNIATLDGTYAPTSNGSARFTTYNFSVSNNQGDIGNATYFLPVYLDSSVITGASDVIVKNVPVRDNVNLFPGNNATTSIRISQTQYNNAGINGKLKLEFAAVMKNGNAPIFQSFNYGARLVDSYGNILIQQDKSHFGAVQVPQNINLVYEVYMRDYKVGDYFYIEVFAEGYGYALIESIGQFAGTFYNYSGTQAIAPLNTLFKTNNPILTSPDKPRQMFNETKLWTSQFFRYVITGINGDEYVFEPEYIAGKSFEPIQYSYHYSFSPENYSFLIAVNLVNDYTAISRNGYLVTNTNNLPLLNSDYNNFIAQNQIYSKSSLVTSFLGTALSFGLFAATKKGPGKFLAGTYAIGRLGDTTNTISNRIDKKLSPQTPKSANSNITYLFNNISNDLPMSYLTTKELTPKEKEIVFDFLYRNGYVINRNENLTPYLTNRARFNFVQVIDIINSLDLNLSQRIRTEVNKMFQQGVTIWHYEDESSWKGILNYEYENTERSLLPFTLNENKSIELQTEEDKENVV